jgi:hypothetical protein
VQGMVEWLEELGGLPAASQTFGFHGATVAVRSQSRRCIESVTESVTPFFEVDPLSSPMADLVLSDDDVPAWAVQAFATGSRILTQQMWWPDRQETLRWWGQRLPIPDGHAVLVIDRATICAVWRQRRRLVVAGRHAGLIGQLVLKDLMRSETWPSVTNLHASCLEADGGAVLVTGAAGSGKTTLSLAGCLGEGLGYVAGDRTVLSESAAGAPLARGWPTKVRVAAGSLSRPELECSGFSASLRAGSTDRRTEKGKFVVSPRELTAFGVRLAPGPLPVRACLFPQLQEDGASSIQPMRSDEARLALHREVLRWPEPDWPHWTEWRPGDRSNPRDGLLVDLIVGSVPCAKVNLGKTAPWPLSSWLRSVCG